ncbi:MAG: hypothetical protein A3K65_06285 [Euryarchaeota archaeon RBG_16_68_12]|nr:MAG: hypothetical protein A3K65_06285 [Euryarchaeota archaeon RBG_16_68_12]
MDPRGVAVSGERILVLGAGIGGLVASSVLKEELGGRARVTVIDRKTHFQFPPSYPWLMLGLRRPDQVQRSLGALRRRGIEVVNDEIVSINTGSRVVRTAGREFPYDHLILAMGADLVPDAVPGFREHAHHVYDLDAALRFKGAIERFEAGTVAVGVARLPFKCPAAPYEVALLLHDHFTKRGIIDRVRFEFFTPEGQPVPSVGPEVGAKVLGFLRSKGIAYRPKLKVSEIEAERVRFESGETILYDLLFCVPPHRAPKAVVEAGLADETGWVAVNPRTLETRVAGVYAVGDVTALPTPKGFVPFLPKAGVFAHGQAEVVAHNIAVRVKGRGRPTEWDGKGACFLETGRGQSAFVRGRFLEEPPKVEFYMPGRTWHMQKALFEKYWMHHWF